MDSFDARWAGSASSRLKGSFAAGLEATSQACDGRAPALLVVFASDDHDLDELGRGVLEAAPDAPVVGCTTAGEITGVEAGSTGLVVFALGGTGFSIATAASPEASADLRAAGADAAREALAGCTGRHKA
ncbi:MAG TPA: FIST N-terminal domain-containing protein, partial [Acidimicrobiales bacterium]|nr:FIST N-terminal domain-containing protein [Acidimicrobiales bacterium]